MEGIFSMERVNTGRQKELDIAKGIAILFMVFVHAFEVFHAPEIAGGTYSTIIEFLGSPPSAPVFMFLLGLGIVYSRRNDSKSLLKRGLHMFGLGYALNIFGDVIPYTILANRYQDASYIQEAWDCFWGVDILAFAGLTFMFFGVVKYFNLKHYVVGIFWCLFTTLHLIVRGTVFESEALNIVGRLFWAVDDYSWFPFLNWITFPILGYFFGELLVRCKDKAKLYAFLIKVFVPLSITLWVYSYINNVKFGAFGELYQYDYYNHDLMGSLVFSSFALVWLGLCYFATPYVSDKIYNSLARWSKNINSIYCIHYILLGMLTLVIEMETLNEIGVFSIGLVVFIVTDKLVEFKNKRKEKKSIIPKNN